MTDLFNVLTGVARKDRYRRLLVAPQGIRPGITQLIEAEAAHHREHGGEPRSVTFCDSLGMNYVSCSPYRVPIARLAAAQSSLSERGTVDRTRATV